VSGTAEPAGTADPWALPVCGLLLDIDDTMVDTRGAMGTALRAAAENAWPQADSATWAAFANRYYADPGGYFDAYTRGEATFAQMRRSRTDEAATALGLPELSAPAFAEFEVVYRAAFARAQALFGDVAPLLDRAAAAGVPVGLLTNSGAVVTADALLDGPRGAGAALRARRTPRRPTRRAGPPCGGTASGCAGRRRSSRGARTARPRPGAVSASAGLEPGSSRSSSRNRRVEVVERLAGRLARHLGGEQPVVQAPWPSTACGADTQCMVDFTLRPSGALPPRVAGS
jgi:hypothetical protein